MAKATVRVEGLRQLGAAMRSLGSDISKKVAVAATGAGARVIRKRAQQNAPIADEDYEVEGQHVPRGNLPKQIVAKQVPKSQRRLTSEHVVAVRGKRKHGYASRVGALQEFGTVKQQPQPFVRPAFDEGKGEALQAITERLRKRIERAQRTGK
ncbi:HK97-gp10 family putative phage morphogenesis protein [Diaphorobacter sp.]|uniref:HK97-gp10 family putative phage morphogenesis protein n=1 Tax=Diaphorobacter sp. TaxID=1934310 RepID=UPI00258BFAC0|nr:HK97-gp10 family putative phage morphogenesis protein [Diaphorobacter sp.]